MSRWEILFRGRVQGVGFRYTARDFAEELGLVGQIRNLSDGGVHLIAEGEEEAIRDLVKRLESYFSVRDKTVIRLQARGDFTGFEITH